MTINLSEIFEGKHLTFSEEEILNAMERMGYEVIGGDGVGYNNKYVEALVNHKGKVSSNMLTIANKLIERAIEHDNSKLSKEEYESFTKFDNTSYKSYKEYEKGLEELDDAFQHHYDNNSHHPEHHFNGVDDMSVLDLIEMVCDWKAVAEYYGVPLEQQMELNIERYGVSVEREKLLKSIMKELQEGK